MYSHAPENYKCPMCAIVKGIEGDKFPETKQKDVVYKDKFMTAFISSHWRTNNPGDVLIIPNEHWENVYDIPNRLVCSVQNTAQKIAIAIRETYKCDGITIRQHNEPAGGQDVWHYHAHVYPRYENDNLDRTYPDKKFSDPEKRIPYAEKLKDYFKNAKTKN